MKNIGRVLAATALALVLAVLFSTACAPSGAAAVTPAPEAAAAATAPTQEPPASPVPTETSLFSEERIVELNQHITDFNNNQENFTKEKKSEMAISTQTTEKLGYTELGIALGTPSLEGHFFDYFEKDGSLILIMGFDGKDGTGFTTLVQIPFYFLKGDSRPRFGFLKYYENNSIYSNTTVVKDVTSENPEDLSSSLDELKGKVIMVLPALQPVPGSKEDYSGSIADYFTDRNSKIGLSGKLVSLVATNEIKIESKYYNEGEYENYEIPKLESIDDAQNIDISEIPMIFGAILFFEE